MLTSLKEQLAVVGVIATICVAAQSLSAQDGGGRRDRFERFREMRRSGMFPPGGPQPTEAKPAEAPKEEKKEEAKPAEAPKDAGPKPVTRPAAASGAKLDEQKLKVDDKSRVTFNFDGAPWSFVLDELARVSNMNLDWQDLPGDALNLRNPRPYTLEEARDTINQHLLARGYTILQNDVTLSVVNLDKLNPASVPRVTIADLDKRSPHEFVKVTFPLGWMPAETAVEEFKPLVSTKGKLTALKSTNRLEAIDAVVNLREIRTLLTEEESAGAEKFVKEIVLEHTRAADIQAQLEVFMGIKKDSGMAAPKNAQEAQMQMQMQMQQQQMRMPQQQQQGQQPGAAKPSEKKTIETRFSVNTRRNSILVQAPPDQLVIIEQTIKYLDVPSQKPSLLTNSNMMQIYRLATIDPAILVSTLESVGDLSPDTRLELDKPNKAIIVYGGPVDQFKVKAVVERLDGADRTMRVIQLRKLEADQVAGSIQKLFIGEQEDNSRSRRRSWGYWGDFGGQQQEEKKQTQFSVDADINQNRLLLRANDIEYQEVMQFLAELGEISPKGGNPNTVRVLDVDSEGDVLERIRKIWPSLGPNELIIQEQPKKKLPAKDEEKSKGRPTDEEQSPKREVDGTTTQVAPSHFHLASVVEEKQPLVIAQNAAAPTEQKAVEQPVEQSPAANGSTVEEKGVVKEVEPNKSSDETVPQNSIRQQLRSTVNEDPESEPKAATPPPISITRGPDGRLVITSQDAQALDRLEELVNQMAPPKKQYAVFHLKYASASMVRLNLEEYFEEEQKKEDGNDRFRRWYWGDWDDDNSQKDTSLRLSKRRPLRFIYDIDSNTIVVQGASPSQLTEIEELIAIYDKPEPQNSRTVRKTQIFQIQYSKAKIIAEAV
ncbi:MAG: secretin N-terminal domain-containing protein [Planctomycetaceae bacterium]